MKYVIEEKFNHVGLTCQVIFYALGHRCGYVNVSKTPLHGIDYSEDLNLNIDLSDRSCDKLSPISLLCWDGEKKSLEILCNVHGGITFSGTFTNDPDSWWIGFDCAHYRDAKDANSIMKYFPEEYDYLNSQGLFDTWMDGSVKNLAYVKQECMNLAEQLQEIISFINIK